MRKISARVVQRFFFMMRRILTSAKIQKKIGAVQEGISNGGRTEGWRWRMKKSDKLTKNGGKGNNKV